ncbi:MAG: LacI family transcriptional regulator [Phycisphaerae bacterium]|nr:LacI family transcriptional regulator [Phycisphaerae bacterium]
MTPPAKPVVTMKEIARLAGVSRQAVSAVLNNRWKEIRLSEPTRRKIEAVLQQTQFKPNSLGRALVLQKSQLIGVVVSAVNYSFFPEALQGMEDLAEQEDYGLLVMTTRDNADRQEQIIRFMLDRNVDGLLVHSLPKIHRPLQDRIRQRNMPVVYMGGDGTSFFPEARSVATDGRQIGALGIRHLMERGHRHIACVDLMDCVRQGVQALLTKSSEKVQVEFWEGLSYREAWKRWHDAPVRPTAVFFMGDDMACRFLSLAIPAGVLIPNQLAVLGVDDIPAAADALIPLTTVAQPRYEQGLAAARLLLDLVKGKEAESIVLQPRLVVRQTT